MKIADFNIRGDPDSVGRDMYRLIMELFPICRSITGDGFRKTMEILQQYIPLRTYEVPSGMKVFDWVVPKEWNVRDAYIKDSNGNILVDFRNSNLHVLNYSVPVKKVVRLQELKEHIFTLPDHPDWVPYRTSYYKENWGFCLAHRQFQQFEDGEYEAFIDSTLQDGSLTYGELYLQGEEEDEIIVSTHACHPSLANDNLSGISLLTLLAKHLDQVTHRYSYRFLFIPGTIGAIAWLSLNEARTTRIKHGLVIAGVGDGGNITYKKSRREDAEIDRVASYVLRQSGRKHKILDFEPYGYDERQFCSPGFNLAVGRLSRRPFGEYPEYHTSADNLDFVNPESLADSFGTVLAILQVLEKNRYYVNLNPKCEPQLGRRGLYNAIDRDAQGRSKEFAMLWVLNLSDGRHSLLDISEKANLPFDMVRSTAELLCSHGLIRELEGAT